ncbi:MAG: tRNA-dihydrouridine synthase family protein [Bacteroidales bacterium]|jgi:nifR3 family TIM-barrel protein|nr:tRNA-dihydrouridine synthase family protein [Bacteroidales bacterium]
MLSFLPEFSLWLAPMESVTDKVFRLLCKKMGADVLVSEFVSSEALIRERASSLSKMALSDEERPAGIQIFGHDENSMRRAAEIAARERPDFIDINWGCPVNKIVKKGAGAAILQDIPKMVRITSAVVKSTNIPVTVKTRLGWDFSSMPIVDVAERLQDTGISGISIHGRTRSQLYAGNADWTLIGKVKNNPRMYIPVFGNGDIDTADKAFLMRERYGVDGVLIGRGAIGNPWIFARTKSLPSVKERIDMLLEHLKGEIKMRLDDYTAAGFCENSTAAVIENSTAAVSQNSRTAVSQNSTAAVSQNSKTAVSQNSKTAVSQNSTKIETPAARAERVSCNEIKIHYGGYFKGLQGFKPFKVRLMQTSSLKEVEAILQEFATFAEI